MIGQIIMVTVIGNTIVLIVQTSFFAIKMRINAREGRLLLKEFGAKRIQGLAGKFMYADIDSQVCYFADGYCVKARAIAIPFEMELIEYDDEF